jgi:hypothetical protein
MGRRHDNGIADKLNHASYGVGDGELNGPSMQYAMLPSVATLDKEVILPYSRALWRIAAGEPPDKPFQLTPALAPGGGSDRRR